VYIVAAADLPAKQASTLSASRAHSYEARSRATWTVLIYANGDNSLEQAIYRNLRQLEDAKFSFDNPKVNFVVQFDGKGSSQMATLDADDRAIPSNSPPGSTVRGRIISTPINPDDPNALKYLVLDSPPGERPELGELDMGSPKTLSDFIQWGESRYPAEKYALIISSHGNGWKYIGPDESSPGAHETFDALYMGELSAALDGHNFEIIILDACLMGMIEVAYQLEPFTQWLVASEDTVPDEGMAYPIWAEDLLKHPSWDGKALGRDIVRAYRSYYEGTKYQPAPVVDWGTISLIDESKLPALISAIDTFAKALRVGSGLFLKPDNRSDNVQLAIMGAANQSPRFPVTKVTNIGLELYGLINQGALSVLNQDFGNFMDLYHFAVLVKADPDIPGCAKTGVDAILSLLDSTSPEGSRVVDTEDHSLGDPVNRNHSVLGGLSIYMPHYRTRHVYTLGISQNQQLAWSLIEEPYDMPQSRVSDGDSMIAIYNSNHDALPLQTRDMDTGSMSKPDGTPLNPRTDWPSVATPNFRFSQTAWSLFLERYYHPVADNHILYATTPTGDRIDPITTPGGACMNSSDSITVPIGSTVNFTGFGSSDADVSPTGSPITPANYAPFHFFWDPNDQTQDCGPCIPPYGVPAGSDPAASANDNMDADADFTNTLHDESVADSINYSLKCTAPGSFKVTLTVWDDNHLFPFHNTTPDAQFVHTQSDSHQATVNCTGAPPAVPPPTLKDVRPGILFPGSGHRTSQSTATISRSV
jgi:hypothetical protein